MTSTVPTTHLLQDIIWYAINTVVSKKDKTPAGRMLTVDPLELFVELDEDEVDAVLELDVGGAVTDGLDVVEVGKVVTVL